MAEACPPCAGAGRGVQPARAGRGVQPELVASAQELMRMLQVIESEILPTTLMGVAARKQGKSDRAHLQCPAPPTPPRARFPPSRLAGLAPHLLFSSPV
jgi:hypothetical protein